MAFAFFNGALSLVAITSPLMQQHAAPRAAVLRMFDEKEYFAPPTSVTRSREAGAARTGTVVITNGADSYYSSRSALQTLYDFGNYAKLVASTPSVPQTKKMLLTRTARYSGLLDALAFHDESDNAAAAAFDGANAWVALHADESTLDAQISAAQAAGVERAFILFSADGPTPIPSDAPALESKLKDAGLAYTIMRVGNLMSPAAVSEAPASGGGLVLGDIDQPVCESVAPEDAYRFVTEALTLDEASSMAFSLCPTEDVSKLRELRLSGYERRDEVRLVLTGVVRELSTGASDDETEAREGAAVEEGIGASVAPQQTEEEREAELKALLAKAKRRGEEVQKKLKYEEEERQLMRERAEGWPSNGGKNKPKGVDPRSALEASLELTAEEREAAAKAKEDEKKKDTPKDGDDSKA